MVRNPCYAEIVVGFLDICFAEEAEETCVACSAVSDVESNRVGRVSVDFFGVGGYVL